MTNTKLKLLLSLGFLFLTLFGNSAKVDTLSIESKTMQKQIKTVVITPDEYQKSTKHYPVVFLLHGYSDNYSSYIAKLPKLKTFADMMNIIIVCPDGGYSSWYVDSPIDKTYQYETFISGELVASIDEIFRTKKDRKDRAITGLSMGGHGALLMAIKHSDVFGVVGSMSGGVDLTFKPKSWHISKRLGEYTTNKDKWLKNSVFHQIHLLKDKNTAIIIDCGTEDFFYGINLNLHAKMNELGISHDFIVRPGNHSWQYWENSIDFQFLFFYKNFYLEKK